MPSAPSSRATASAIGVRSANRIDLERGGDREGRREHDPAEARGVAVEHADGGLPGVRGLPGQQDGGLPGLRPGPLHLEAEDLLVEPAQDDVEAAEERGELVQCALEPAQDVEEDLR